MRHACGQGFPDVQPLTEFGLHETLGRPNLWTNMTQGPFFAFCGCVSLQSLRQRTQSARPAVGPDPMCPKCQRSMVLGILVVEVDRPDDERNLYHQMTLVHLHFWVIRVTTVDLSQLLDLHKHDGLCRLDRREKGRLIREAVTRTIPGYEGEKFTEICWVRRAQATSRHTICSDNIA